MLRVALTLLLAAAPERRHFLIPSEIVKRIEDAKLTYGIAELDRVPSAAEREDLAGRFWEKSAPVLRFPRRAGGQVVETDVPLAVGLALDERDGRIALRRCATALALDAALLKKNPSLYPALAELGRCAMLAGDLDGAQAHLTRAIAADPYDDRAWLLAGDLLADQGHSAEALDAYAWALVARPHSEPLRAQLASRLGKLDRQLEGDLLTPPVTVEWHGASEIRIRSISSPDWLAWGLCKALWLGDEAHRLEMTGSRAHGFNSLEELECLGSLLSVYRAHRLQDRGTDPQLDQLFEIFRRGRLTEFVLFELAARVAPHATAELDDGERARVHEYVLDYVFVPSHG